jgi:prevent-host-death family protein
MPKTWNLSTAKAQLSALVDRALRGEPQRIERRGETVVVVSASAFERMSRPKQSLLELFSSHPEIEIDLDVDRAPADDREIVEL